MQYGTTTIQQEEVPSRRSFQLLARNLPRAQMRRPPPVPTTHGRSSAPDQAETGWQVHYANVRYWEAALHLKPEPDENAQWLHDCSHGAPPFPWPSASILLPSRPNPLRQNALLIFRVVSSKTNRAKQTYIIRIAGAGPDRVLRADAGRRRCAARQVLASPGQEGAAQAAGAPREAARARAGVSQPLDWKHFKLYDRFVKVSERALARTDAVWAPWTLVEATDDRYRELMVGAQPAGGDQTPAERRTGGERPRACAVPLGGRPWRAARCSTASTLRSG